MDVSAETIRRNFQSKTATELLELGRSGSDLGLEARQLLVLELQSRLAKTKQAAETIRIQHGWYTVCVPSTGAKFPDFCPRCARLADTSLRFASPEERRFHLLWWKTTRAVSNVPHCSGCVAELKRSRLICSSTWGLVGFLWIAAAIWFHVPRLAIYVGLFTISAPFVYLYDRESAVKLGGFGEGVLEYRFKSHDYAKAFAMLNNVQAESAETLQAELEEAIARVQA